MRITCLVPDDYHRMPWQNGLGVTTEIARAPVDGELFDWRVSIASVANDGPFSRFPGCDRIITVIDGAGMVLSHAETQASIARGPLDSHEFSGDVVTSCALPGGPIRDFNVITRRDAFRAALTVIRLERDVPLAGPAPLTLVHCLTGAARFAWREESLLLEAGQTARIEHEAALEDPLTLSPAAKKTILLRVDLSAAG